MGVNKILKFGKRLKFYRVIVFILGAVSILMFPLGARAGYASFVIDADNGKVIHSDRADVRNHPASLTKMMTLYLLFESLDQGTVTMATKMPVSSRAAGQAPSRLGVAPGQAITVEDAILSLVTKSANDVACVIAEFLGGSEKKFALAMTAKARALGMAQTEFLNASGLPNSGQVTSARDMATLARALIKRYPKYYHYFSTREFTYGTTRITTHNRLLLSYEGADGLKTGYIGSSGFNLVTSAKRDGHRLVGVVLGGRTSRWRDQHMADLLDASFAQVSGGHPPVTARVSPPPSSDAVESPHGSVKKVSVRKKSSVGSVGKVSRSDSKKKRPPVLAAKVPEKKIVTSKKVKHAKHIKHAKAKTTKNKASAEGSN